MGCGASKVTPHINDEESSHAEQSKAHERSNGHSNGITKGDVNHPISSVRKDGDSKRKIAEINGNVLETTADVSENRIRSASNGVFGSHTSSPLLSPNSRSVAFDIPLRQNGSVSSVNRPPRRLQKIESAPVLTREALEQKQAAAELKRQKELDKKVKVMSKRRSELLLAREMDKAQHQKAELEEKLAATEKKRERAQASIKEKQRRREEKAKRVRIRAKKMKDGDDVADLNVDPDETYNADEEDESWDIGSPQSFTRSTGPEVDNYHQTIDGKSSSESNMNEDEKRDVQQQDMNEVHDFFDL